MESLADLIRDAIEERVREIATCFPARVLAYDVATQTASLRPCVQRPVVDEDETAQVERLPDLQNVPVAFPRAGDFVLHLPLAADDFVLVVCATWPISEWRHAGGDTVDPGDARHHDVGNAVAIAGIFPSGQAVEGLSTTDLLLGKPSGPAVKITASKVQLGTGATKPVARRTDQVQVTLDGTAVAGILAPPGGGPCTLASGAITLTGTITAGSSVVEASD
jgi:hypothetical protein